MTTGPQRPPARRRSRAARRRSLGAARTLHLVDVDNLLNDPSTTNRLQIATIFDAYRWVAQFRPGDHVVVATGCNGLHVIETELAWPTARHRRRPGVNGADVELLEEIDDAVVEGRYAHVVLGSGDGIFEHGARELRRAGVGVTVVSRPLSLSWRLQRAADEVRYLPPAV